MKWKLVLVYGLFWCMKVEAQIERYALVINEIMADPSPIVGLPNAEYIELRNNSSAPVNLFKWRINNGTTTATVAVNYLLAPDSLVIFCSKTQVVFFNQPSKTIGLTSFPALANEGDCITLSAPDGKTIHAVEYDLRTYGNPVKDAGGWSLEMINPLNPCSSMNWKASTDEKGGTPGRENSVINKATKPNLLEAIQCIAISNNHLLLTLNQGADSLSLSMAAHYQIKEAGIQVISAIALPPLFKAVTIQLGSAMEANRIYHLQARSLAGCNNIGLESVEARTGLTKQPDVGDLVINELLFNPPSGGADFIELYNPSQFLLNIKDLLIGSRNDAGLLGNFYAVSENDHLLFPGENLVLSTDTAFIKRQWSNSDKKAMVEVKSLPSLPDDKGNIVVVNKQGKPIDELSYADDWHFPLLKEKEAVSLERIDPLSPSSDPGNWHSAASDMNYATPTMVNSQYKKRDSATTNINMFPALISPNNDGVDDFLNIQYRFKEPGSLMSAFLFSQNGQRLSTIIENRLCGTEGRFVWSGLDSKNNRLPAGVYVVLVESFNLNGKSQRMKKAVGIRF